MKLKVKTPDTLVIGFTRRELLIIGNCLQEASNGLLADRFVPAQPDLHAMLASVRAVTDSRDFFKIAPLTI